MNYKNREQYKHLMRVLAVAAIVLLECAVFSVFWDRYYASHLWLEPFWDKGNQIIVVIYGIFLLVFMYIYGGMKIGYMKGSSIIYSQMMTAFCANALMYLQIILLWRHLPYILPMVGMTLVDFALAGIVSWLFEKTFARLFPPREVLLIYGEYPMESLELKMNQRPDKYIVAHKVSVEVGEKELCRQIDAYGQEGVILGDLHSELRNRLLKYCYAKEIRVYLTPKLSDIMVRKAEALHIFDTPLLLARNSGLSFDQRFCKRLLDLLVSTILLVITSPIMLIAALCIKLYDHGPVFFKQKRLTIGGKEFYVYKFRSMIVDAEKDGVARLATKNDSRITPVGKVIRATRIDELPQLLNIFKGDMSVVGPRPERPEIAKEYEAAGADCISVLTEPKWFLGNDEYLKEIAEAVLIPCLRKDFTVDEYQIYQAKVLGASAVLLICSVLTESQMKDYIRICDELGLSALAEVHDEQEVQTAINAGARIIGVNNRNLKDFSVDTDNSRRLRELIPPNVLFVSESGVRTAEDVETLRKIGADAVLIGETLMRASDKRAKLAELRGAV